jgi:hypothetical protein
MKKQLGYDWAMCTHENEQADKLAEKDNHLPRPDTDIIPKRTNHFVILKNNDNRR